MSNAVFLKEIKNKNKENFKNKNTIKTYKSKLLNFVLALLINLIILGVFLFYFHKYFPLDYKDKQMLYLEEKYRRTQDINTLVDMAWLYYEKGDKQKAKNMVEDVLKGKLGFNNTGALYVDALFKYKEKNYIGAKEQLEKILGLTQNKHELSLFLLAQLYYDTKDYFKALDAINKAIKLNNIAGDYYFLRGKIFMELKEKQKAKEDMERTLQFLPDHKDAKRLYGAMAK